MDKTKMEHENKRLTEEQELMLEISYQTAKYWCDCTQNDGTGVVDAFSAYYNYIIHHPVETQGRIDFTVAGNAYIIITEYRKYANEIEPEYQKGAANMFEFLTGIFEVNAIPCIEMMSRLSWADAASNEEVGRKWVRAIFECELELDEEHRKAVTQRMSHEDWHAIAEQFKQREESITDQIFDEYYDSLD